MYKGIRTVAGGTAVLCAALIVAPGYTAGQRAHEAGNQELAEPQVRDFNVMWGEEGGSWLGVETSEVTSDNAKELKLPVFEKTTWLRKSMGSRWKARCNFGV
jgi:hypothetical protein